MSSGLTVDAPVSFGPLVPERAPSRAVLDFVGELPVCETSPTFPESPVSFEGAFDGFLLDSASCRSVLMSSDSDDFEDLLGEYSESSAPFRLVRALARVSMVRCNFSA